MNFSTSLYYDPTADINAFYAQQQSIAEQAAQRQAEMLLQQYERSVAEQKEARAQQEAAALAGYNSLLEAAKARYDNALSQRQQSYDKAVDDVNGVTERAMQQAYLSNELQKRNIGQQLAALGRSGGASETTLLNMANNYGNARGEIDKNRTSQLGALASDFSAGKASDLDTYNSAKAGYDYDYRKKLAELANAAQEKLLGYSNTYTSGLAQTEQNKEQQLAQLRSAHQEALTQTQQELARLRAEEAARLQAEEAARLQAEEAARQQAEEAARQQAAAQAAAQAQAQAKAKAKTQTKTKTQTKRLTSAAGSGSVQSTATPQAVPETPPAAPATPVVVKPGSITGVTQTGSAVRSNKIYTTRGQALK